MKYKLKKDIILREEILEESRENASKNAGKDVFISTLHIKRELYCREKVYKESSELAYWIPAENQNFGVIEYYNITNSISEYFKSLKIN